MMEPWPLAVIVIRKLNKTTGAARIALQQISILKNMGYRVKVICEKADKNTIESHGAEVKIVHKLPLSSFLKRLWFSQRANYWCRRHKPSLVISHGDMENSDVIYMHNCVDLAQEVIYPYTSNRSIDVSKMHRRILQKSDYKHIVANSKMMANDLISRYSIPSDKVSVSYPGFDALQFNPSVHTNFRSKKRDELGIASQGKLIGLITSGDFKKRNLNFFIDIANQLLNNAKVDYYFLVIGQGDISSYREKTVQLGIEEHFIWKKTVPNVEHYYAALDVFILPAYIEEFGCVVLEAMACSTAILVSEHVGAAELLQGELESLVIKGYNPDNWSQAVENIIHGDNTRLKQQLVNTAKNYSYDYQYKALEEVIFKQVNINVKDGVCFTQPTELPKR